MEFHNGDFQIQQASRELQCHKCETVIPKGAIKIKADLGRVAKRGYVWWYQLCIPCAKKKIHEWMCMIDEWKDKLEMQEYKMKREQDREQWLE